MGRLWLWVPSLIAACAVVLLNLYLRGRMPAVVPPTAAANVFSGAAAYATLENLTTSLHPIETQANLDVYNYVYDKLLEMNATATVTNNTPNFLTIETPRSKWTNFSATPSVNANANATGKTRGERCDQHGAYINDTQIVVRVPGVLPSSVLLTAHFDSAEKSHGASDDGAGVAVILETLRALLAANATPMHTLIAFIDNGEEVGLCGSRWFINSQFVNEYKVKTFVNLEGGGVGGRAILFRATDNGLASLYSKVAPYPHMNSMGGSLISLLGSATDYENYEAAGIPGVDIAFYERRQFYHTPQDDIAHITAEDVQHMGSNAMEFTLELLNTASLDEWGVDGSSPYFDIVGTFGVTLSATTRVLWVLVLWILTAATVLVHFHFFPVKATTLNKFVWSLVGAWCLFFSALGLGVAVAIAANLPLVGVLLFTHKPLLSWTVVPSTFFGHVFGVAIAAGQFRRRHAVLAMPPMIDWMHIATAGSTFGAFLSLFFLLDAPTLYLIPLAAFTYTAILFFVLVGSLLSQWLKGEKPGSIWKSHISYSSIPLVTSADITASTASTPLISTLVVAILVYFFIALQFPVDMMWSLQSVGGYDPKIMAVAPVFFAPAMYLLFPWLLTWDPQDGLYIYLSELYALVWIVATVQYATV